MPFKIREYQKKTFEKPTFLNLTLGNHIVRFLEPTDDADLCVSHFLVTPTGRFSVVCLGDDCPICENNRKLWLEHQKDAIKQPGYFGKSDRYTLNVLDRTPAKICPSCQAEVKAVGKSFPATCPECSTLVANIEPHPVNKVKLLQLSKTLATQLNDIEDATMDKDGNPLGLTSFDMVFAVSEKSGKKIVTPIASSGNNDKIEVPKEAFLDKKQGALRLQADEIKEVLTGVSLKDIFAARKAATAVEPTPTKSDDVDAKTAEDLTAEINLLFNN